MMKTEQIDWKARSSERQQSLNADQVEFLAMRRSRALYSAGVQDDRIADDELIYSQPELGAPDIASFARRDARLEDRISSLRGEIERRANQLGNDYPFDLDDTGIRHVPNRSAVYEFCLCTVRSPNITKGCFAHLPRIFERVAARIVARDFGTRAEAFDIGAPRDRSADGSPISFRQAFEAVYQRSKTWAWQVDPALGDTEPKSGDEGCDFVIRRPSVVGRPIGELFVVGQCACGDDWDTKFGDLDLKRLDRWLRQPDVPPVRAFATCFALGDAQLYHASGQAGLVYDRLRLTRAAVDADLDAFAPRLRNACQLIQVAA